MSVDSIRSEIDLHRGTMPEPTWLAEKKLIDIDSINSYSFELLSDWHMPGSESFIMDFQINSLKRTERVIAKACIKMGASAVVQEWISRRELASSAGIEVPKLYSVSGPDILEEYIPQTLKQVYEKSDSDKREHLHHEFFTAYQKLIKLGFSPVSLHDVRSHGEDIVIVDFGSDLGGIHTSRQDTDLRGYVGIGERFSTKINNDFQNIIR